MHGLLIDLDGVLYEGETPITGAADTLAWLDEQAIPKLFVTNTSSRPRSALVDKLAAMGIAVTADEILTPAVTAVSWLNENCDGPVALFVAEPTKVEFSALTIADEDSADNVAAVVIGDYGEGWSFAELNRAFRLLMGDPQPALVALGMTRYWHAPDGLRLDTAPFVVALSHATGVEPVVLGKPAVPFFETALALLGTTTDETLMIGDDIRTDVGAAQDFGVRGILVRTGKYLPGDLELGIEPWATIDTVADLPCVWRESVEAD